MYLPQRCGWCSSTMSGSITDIPGIRVGHASDGDALTGCTVVLCEAGAMGGVDQRGGAPGAPRDRPVETLAHGTGGTCGGFGRGERLWSGRG